MTQREPLKSRYIRGFYRGSRPLLSPFGTGQPGVRSLMRPVLCISGNAVSKSASRRSLYAFNLVLIPRRRRRRRRAPGFAVELFVVSSLRVGCLTSCLLVFLRCFLCPCVHLCPPDTPTTSPPSTTPPLHPNPADHTVLLGPRASEPALPADRGNVPPHTSPLALLHDLSLCASPAVRLSECFLLP